MTVSDWISLSSAAVAIVAALTAYLSLLEQRRISAISANIAMLNETESKLANSASLLQLHGVTQKMLKECDASAEEVVYLLNSFNAAQNFYAVKSGHRWLFSRTKVTLSAYRKNLLSNPKVRIIWKEILKGRLITEGRFFSAVDNFIAEMECG